MNAGIFTLVQILDGKHELSSFSVLKVKYHLSVATNWQYLQLQHLLTICFGSMTFLNNY